KHLEKMVIAMCLGNRLRSEREKRRWSQLEVAKRIGITNAVLSNYERGSRDPDTSTLKKLADLYEVSVDYLLGTLSASEILLNEKNEKDVAKRLEKVKKDLENAEDDDGYMLMGEPISEEAKQSIIEAMEFAIRQSNRINKKYTPKKYRKE
ncbi:MAG: helix-turn-helix transcriptional regulator, partial [Sporolactobacillus sp.]